MRTSGVGPSNPGSVRAPAVDSEMFWGFVIPAHREAIKSRKREICSGIRDDFSLVWVVTTEYSIPESSGCIWQASLWRWPQRRPLCPSAISGTPEGPPESASSRSVSLTPFTFLKGLNFYRACYEF